MRLNTLLFALVLTFVTSGVSAQEKQKSIRIGSGAAEGGYHKVAELLKTTKIEKNGKLRRIMTVSTGGSITNIKALRSGEFSLGFSQENITQAAYSGTDIFTDYGAVPSLRSIARLYPEYLFIVTRADSKIDSLEALRGTHVGLGSAGSGTLEASMRLLASAGIKENDLRAHFGRIQQIIENFKRKKVEAFFYMSTFPSTILEALNAEVPIKLISIRKSSLNTFIRKNQGFVYAKLEKPYASDRDVQTLSIGAQLITREEMPEEEVYLLTKNLWDSSSKIGPPLDIKLALNNLTAPLHPGAERYYREKNLLEK